MNAGLTSMRVAGGAAQFLRVFEIAAYSALVEVPVFFIIGEGGEDADQVIQIIRRRKGRFAHRDSSVIVSVE
jgi:hypothetical protein